MLRNADKVAKKMGKVMGEWAGGKLNIGKSKETVPETEAGRKQAIAIGLSMMKKSKKK
jgi:hypothetical protein